MSLDNGETHWFTCGCSLCTGQSSADNDPVEGGAGAPPVFTLTQIQTQLRTQWGGNQEGKTWTWLGTTNVTYSIDASVSGQSEASGLIGMTTLMEDRARLAFELWDDLISLSLTESVGNVNANITLNYSSNTTGGGTYAEWSGYSSSGNFGMSRAYIWMNNGWSSHNTDASMAFGGYGFMTYLHEIGHTLGLSHPGTYNSGNGGSITYANNAEYAQDSHRYTVMSYFDANEAESFVDHYGASGIWKYAQTPLLHDIAAIQATYGADTTTRTGDTVYGFNSNAGRVVYDFTQNIDPILVIWDSGGIDTLDCSGYSQVQVINLNAGTYSSIGRLTYNVAIAFNCTIENAIGGSGNDTIIGNAVNNVIDGGAGVDALTGGGGADTFVFKTGASGTAANARDRVTDFTIGTDLIDLSGWDANSSLAGINQFSWLGTAGFNGQAGGLRYSYNSTRGVTILQGDTNGDNVANFAIDFTGNLAFTQAQFTAGSFVGAPPLPVLPFKGIGDFTGDGRADILWQTQSGQPLFWQLYGFSVAGEENLRPLGNWFIRGLGDFNGDGRSDLLLGDNSNAVYVVQMNGSSIIREGGLPFANASWNFLGTGDFNGDGKDDILWRDNAGAIHIWKVNSTSVTAQASIAAPAGLQFKGIGDFNGDGESDILWQDANRQLFFWEMDGLAVGSIGNIRTPSANQFVRGLGDFNGDGKTDILLGDNSNAVYVLLMNGTSIMQEGGLPFVNGSWTLLGINDINGDGKSDILWRDGAGVIQSWQAVATTVTAQGTLSPGSAPPSLYFEGIGDFAGDGRADILWLNDDGLISFWELDGLSVVGEGSVLSLNPRWFIRGVGDFNGDGNSDILLGDESNAVYILEMDGSDMVGTGGLPYVDSTWSFLGTGDVNGDGKSDILWRDDTRAIHIWQMDGTTITAEGSISGTPTHFRGVGDFDGDGESDLLWHDSNGQVLIWEMDGLSVGSVENVLMLSSQWFVRGVGDFNGDGKSDIVLGDATNAVYVLQMNGSSIASQGGLPYVDSSWNFMGTGDANGDGKDDIFWRDDLGVMHIWQMNGVSLASQGAVSGGGSGSEMGGSAPSVPSIGALWPNEIL